MKTIKQSKTALPIAVAMAAIGLVAPSSKAETVLLEQFDYEGVDTPLNGMDGGIGFEGAWLVTGWSRNYDIGRTVYANGPATTTNARGGLEFEGLDTAGSALGRFGTAGQRQAQRELSAASKAALTADSTTIWFSVLAGPPSNGNKFGTFIFGTDPMVAQQSAPPFPNANLSSATGQAFGVGFRIDNGGVAGGGTGSPNAVAFIDSDSATVAVGSYLPPITDGGTHHDTSLIVGKINWKPNGTEDELFLFNMATGTDPEPEEADAIASLTADFDQSNFTLLSLQDTGSTIYDEIRFGTSFSDVTGGASRAPFTIRQIDYSPGDNMVTLTWDSSEGEQFAIKFSKDMTSWTSDLDDGVNADAGETTTRTFALDDAGLVGATRVYFRVERQ